MIAEVGDGGESCRRKLREELEDREGGEGYGRVGIRAHCVLNPTFICLKMKKITSLPPLNPRLHLATSDFFNLDADFAYWT